MSDGRGWRFRDATGTEREMSTAELRGALASGALPVDTHVTRAGFDGWVRAGDVPELFPRTLTPPPPNAAMDGLPEPPAFLQAVQQAYEKDGISLGEARPALPTIPGHAPPPDQRPAPLITMAPSTMASPGRAPSPAIPPPAGPASMKSSKPTLIGAPIAVVPPPTPTPKEATQPPLPPAAATGQKTRAMQPLHAPHVPIVDLPQPDATPETPKAEPPAELLLGDAPDEPPTKPRHQGPHGTLALPIVKRERSDDDPPLTLPTGHENPHAPIKTTTEPDPFGPPPDGVPRGRPKLLPIVIGAVGVVALLGVIATARAIFRGKAPPPPDLPATTATTATTTPSTSATTSASASAASPSTTTPKEPSGGSLQACKAGKAAAKIAPRASKDVPVELAAWPATSRVAVGFSPEGRTAAGVSLDTATLASRRERVPKAFGKLRRSVPLPSDKTLRYAVDTDITLAKKTLPVQRTETIASEPSYQVGVSDGALVALDKPGDPPKRLFTIPGGAIDAMESLPMGTDGAVLAVRAGSAIYLGLVSSDHAARGELAKLSDAGQVGAPSLGTNGAEVAAAFAWRASGTDPWSIRWTHGAKGSAPGTAVPFAIPAGGPGGDVFAPSISGLPDGRWLFTWTEGSSGARVVRVATLAADGSTLDGSALTLSPAGTSAGQATAAPFGTNGVMVVFLTQARVKNVFDLWATTLECL